MMHDELRIFLSGVHRKTATGCVEPYHGECGCGWESKQCRNAEEVGREFDSHVSTSMDVICCECEKPIETNQWGEYHDGKFRHGFCAGEL